MQNLHYVNVYHLNIVFLIKQNSFDLVMKGVFMISYIYKYLNARQDNQSLTLFTIVAFFVRGFQNTENQIFLSFISVKYQKSYLLCCMYY
jgi:hypothetical protein